MLSRPAAFARKLIPRRRPGRRRPIVQFSAPRSGSTLVFNFLRETQRSRKVIKVHSLPEKHRSTQIVATYRHPFDMVLSQMASQGYYPITDEMVEKSAEDLEQNGLFLLCELRGKRNTLLLQYEKFYCDYDYIFDHIEAYLGTPIAKETRSRLAETYNVAAVKAQTDKMGGFQDFDRVTHLHGRHVSERMGEPYGYREALAQRQVRYLADRFAPFLQAFGYPRD